MTIINFHIKDNLDSVFLKEMLPFKPNRVGVNLYQLEVDSLRSDMLLMIEDKLKRLQTFELTYNVKHSIDFVISKHAWVDLLDQVEQSPVIKAYKEAKQLMLCAKPDHSKIEELLTSIPQEED